MYLQPTGGIKMVQDLLSRSHPAVCGIMERELLLSPKNIPRAKARLKAAGFMIIGVGEPEFGGRKRRLWFIRRGGF
jgi:hypothetical protein